MLGLSSTHKSGPLYGVLIDVGSGSVRIGIVRSDPNEEKPEILYTHREYIRIGENPSPDERVRAMRQALFAASLQLSEEGLKALHTYDPRAVIKRILVVCAAPWSKTVTQTVHLQKEEPFTVTHEWITDLIEKAQKQNPTSTAQDELLKELGMSVVERSVVNIQLNGYATEHPYGKEAREISVSHLSGLAPREILDAVVDIEDNVLAHARTSTHTYALVLYCVLRDLYPHTQNAVFVDVSGEATEIGIIDDGVLFDTAVIPYGSFTLTRALARKLNTIPEEAKAYLSDHIELDQNDRTREAIEEVTKTFESELLSGLQDISESYVLPRNMFITVDPELEHYALNVLKRLRKQVSGTSVRSVVSLGAETANKIAYHAEGVATDTFLAVAARFFHKLHACGEIEDRGSSDILDNT